MQKRMTITMDEAVYEGLVRVVGRRKISAFLELENGDATL